MTKSGDVPVIQSELQAVKLDVESVKSAIASLDAKLDARFDQLQGEIHKVLMINEEQNARNKSVMASQAYTASKLETHETRLFVVEKTLNEIK